jgi:hypothetical protein
MGGARVQESIVLIQNSFSHNTLQFLVPFPYTIVQIYFLLPNGLSHRLSTCLPLPQIKNIFSSFPYLPSLFDFMEQLHLLTY